MKLLLEESYFSRTSKESQLLLYLLIEAGSIMLKHGAETYRVEDTIKRLGESRGADLTNSFVIPSAIFISINYDNEILTYIQRVSPKNMDLNKIHLINQFSRDFVDSNISIQDGIKKIKDIEKKVEYKPCQILIASGVVSSTFTKLFGSNWNDMFFSFIIGISTMLVINYIRKYNFVSFINNFIAGFTAAFLSAYLYELNLVYNVDLIVIGVIMPLLPGYSLTNSIRDAIVGDHISSLSRGLDAALSGIAMAIGVAIAIKITS